MEFVGFNPFSVNPTERTDVDGPVFFTVMNLETLSKFMYFVWPRVIFDEVTKGVAETWYEGTNPSCGKGDDIYSALILQLNITL